MRRFIAILLLVTVPLTGCLAGEDPTGSDPAADVSPGDAAVWNGEVDRPVDEALSQTGRWLEPFETEQPAIHATMLLDGDILLWAGLEEHASGDGSPFLASPPNAESRVMDLSGPSQALTTPSPADGGASDLFCTGQTLLPDGRVLAVGGTRWETAPDAFIYGTPDVRTYDPATNTWTQAPEMGFDRWYPSTLVLPDGRALIAAGIGKVDDPSTMVEQLEIYDPDTDQIELLPSSADRDLPMYPRLYVVPSGPLAGHVFYQPAGCLWCPGGNSDAEQTWNWAASFDPASQTWTTHDPSLLGARNAPVTALLPLRPPDYDARILTATGTLNRMGAATPTAEITDLTTDTPTHAPAAPMNDGRWFANHVTLPDGTLLVAGGAKHDGVLAPGTDQNPLSPVMSVERFDPTATDPETGLPGTWTLVPEITNARVYHSTALLLPDGRVWLAGSVPAQAALPGSDPHHETTVEIYEPPYLFRGDRPAITQAPSTLAWGESFHLDTDDPEAVDQVVLVRAGSVTHVYNPEQRLIELPITEQGPDGLTVDAPRDAALAPPGGYMLFVLEETDLGPVPSVAAMVHVGTDAVARVNAY